MRTDHKIKTDLVKAYDRYAQERDKREIAPWKMIERDHFLQILKEKQKKNVLEIGAGTGKDSRFFKDTGFTVISTDISFEMAKLCNEKGLFALVMDLHDLGFSEESFDAIWSMNCLLHVPKRELPGVLKGIRAVLKTRGLFYMGVYGGFDHQGPWQDDSYRPRRFFSLYADEALQDLLVDFFEILYFKTVPLNEKNVHFQSVILRKN